MFVVPFIKIPKFFRNDSGFPIVTGYLKINRTGALVLDCCTDLVGNEKLKHPCKHRP